MRDLLKSGSAILPALFCITLAPGSPAAFASSLLLIIPSICPEFNQPQTSTWSRLDKTSNALPKRFSGSNGKQANLDLMPRAFPSLKLSTQYWVRVRKEVRRNRLRALQNTVGPHARSESQTVRLT